MSHIQEILNSKSADKEVFTLCICNHDMEGVNFQKSMKDALEWLQDHDFTARFLKPDFTMNVDGKEILNPFLELSVVEFRKQPTEK